MKVRALQMSDLLKECDDIYTTAMVIAQRSKQIIDERVVPIEDVEDVEDSIQFSDPEPVIEFNDKPMVQALEEYLDGELEWRAKDDSDESSDN
tara:strand:+ start:140 stop:418 length:279 start_codon:yes stop_codon:yes gene_type:complete